MTERTMKRKEWVKAHPLCRAVELPKTATCYRCGRTGKGGTMAEVGDNVYICMECAR